MTHNLTTMMAVSRRENPTRFQKTLAFNDFYDGEPGYPFPMGNVQTLGKLQSGMLVAGAKYLPQPIARELTKRSFDILTTSEDLPEAEQPSDVATRRRPDLRPGKQLWNATGASTSGSRRS